MMLSDYTLTVARAGLQMFTNVPAQIDHLSQNEAAYYGGAAPYLRYKVFFTTLPFNSVQQGDLLIDQVNIDPFTQTNTHYRVINDPKFLPDGHAEMITDKVRGT